MRGTTSLLALLLLAPAASAWTAGPDRPHHADLAELAAQRLPPELRDLIQQQRDAFRRGALDPDGVTDPNADVHTFFHAYEPANGGGGGVYQVELALHEATMAMREGAPPAEVAYRLGFLTHFVLDLAVPFHTGEGLYDHDLHEAFELGAYDHRDDYEVALSRGPQEVSDPSAYAKELAQRSAALAPELLAAFERSGGAWTPEAAEIAARAATMGVEAAADMLYTAHLRADPARPAPSFDDTQMPLPREAEDVGLSLRELRRNHPAALVAFFCALAAAAVGGVAIAFRRKLAQ